MLFELAALPVRRPTATVMFFLAMILLGVFAWTRIPIELLPALSGEQLFISFGRPGSEPEVVEREILMPLEARVGELAGLSETWGEVNGSSGQLVLEFERGTNHRIRELELRSIAAELQRGQPRGTFVSVTSQDLSTFSRFAMIINVTGGDDRNALRDVVDERIQPRLAALPGVSQVLATGGAPREVTVWVDPDRAAALGIRVELITALLGQSVQRLRYVGGTERGDRRWQVVVDGRPAGVASLGEMRVDPARPVLLRHIAEIEMTTALEQSAFRIDGRDATGLIVFQEEGANLVQLGRALRSRLEELRAEFAPYGIDFRIGFDAAETVEEQLNRLESLALSGFIITLLVLFLFLRDLRAVGVVAVAVPVSLLVAGAFLYLGGYTLNLITMLGLVVGIGMLVDNSIVVFEAVQRGLERNLRADVAAIAGIRRTIRAIVAASATNAIVFLPPMFLVEDSLIRGMLELIAVAILLPLAASLVVAVGLVPLLAERLAAPAALARLARNAERRRERDGSVAPQPTRALLSALLKSALRRPTAWIASVSVAIMATVVIALPWVIGSSLGQPAAQAEQVGLQIELGGSTSLDKAKAIFERAEQSVLDLPGIELVESSFEEIGGSLTVHLDPEARDSGGASPARIRNDVRAALEGLDAVEVSNLSLDGGGEGGGAGGPGGGGGGGNILLGTSSSDVLLSGPDMGELTELALEIQARLRSIPEVEDATISGREGQDELHIVPIANALTSYRLNPEDVLNALNVFRREGVQLQVGFTLADGRELPLTVRRPELTTVQALASIGELKLATDEGALTLGSVTAGSRVPAPPTISHHNGRRELSISYSLGADAPESGPERVRLEEAIQNSIREAFRPPGYTIETVASESTNWFKRVIVPVLLLLFAVLAISFESLTMPVLILIAVPLTILGAVWALVLAGVGAGIYAMVGVIALLGLTVNPGILLVDRMQQRVAATGCSGGSAAIAAVRERTRPVLMTTCTTIAGLWPLALSTGGEFEIWPPFAVVVMGGLATSTLLTLLVIPIGYVLLQRIDRIFGRLGPWVVIAWLALTAAVITPLVLTGQLDSMTWQVITTVLVASLLLALAVRLLHRAPEPVYDATGYSVETRYLRKVYGRPGVVKRAWQTGRDVLWRFTPRESRERAMTYALLLAGAGYLAINLETAVWRVLFAYIAAAFASRMLIELYDALKPLDARAEPQLLERRAALGYTLRTLAPWGMLAIWLTADVILPGLRDEDYGTPVAAFIVLAVLTAVFQLGRRAARRAAARSEALSEIPRGLLAAACQRACLAVFGFDLPRREIEALATTTFAARQGMIGILGPNGAGKTTLLRLLAGILDPSAGSIHYGGHLKRRVGGSLSRWIGYLPQEFGLPNHLTAEEYLDYFALLYGVGTPEQRRARVAQLLEEVGLHERRREAIGGYSGGMRQRVAVARTLLRQPPIIIVDEPTVGLDPRERIRFRNLLSRLAEGRVVLFSTHVVEDVAVSCQRVIVMSRGRIVFDGRPADLAELAQGMTWELRLPESATPSLAAGSKIVDQVPEAGGIVRLRVLSAASPHAEARAIEPVIEDGYLRLMNFGAPANA
jgi:multidrug efflux pump subunit AcrB/ABC-type multidrug transport system ATPase subunit